MTDVLVALEAATRTVEDVLADAGVAPAVAARVSRSLGAVEGLVLNAIRKSSGNEAR